MAKATRRDLRRAVGVEALSAFQANEQALGTLANALNTTQRELEAVQKATLRNLATLTEAVNDEVEARQAFQAQTFWQRLSWVLFGA